MVMAFVTGIAAVAGRRAGAMAAAAAAPRVALLGPARRDLGLAAHESPTAPPRVAPFGLRAAGRSAELQDRVVRVTVRTEDPGYTVF